MLLPSNKKKKQACSAELRWAAVGQRVWLCVCPCVTHVCPIYSIAFKVCMEHYTSRGAAETELWPIKLTCFVLAVLTQQRKEGEHEPTNICITVHEGQLVEMWGCGVVITAVFLTGQLYGAFLGTWQMHGQAE